MKLKWWIILAVLIVLAVGAVFVLTQTNPVITKTAVVTLSVKPAPDLIFAVQPAHIDSPVGRTVAYSATVTSVNNFTGVVNLSTSGLPTGFTVTMFPATSLTLGAGESKGIQININIGSNPALIGDYTITVTAESTNYN